MKVLIVCSGNFENTYDNFHLQQSFVHEQMESLKKLNVEFEIFLIKGKGFLGYLSNIVDYNRKILINSKTFSAVDVNITNNSITISNHNFKSMSQP